MNMWMARRFLFACLYGALTMIGRVIPVSVATADFQEPSLLHLKAGLKYAFTCLVGPSSNPAFVIQKNGSSERFTLSTLDSNFVVSSGPQRMVGTVAYQTYYLIFRANLEDSGKRFTCVPEDFKGDPFLMNSSLVTVTASAESEQSEFGHISMLASPATTALIRDDCTKDLAVALAVTFALLCVLLMSAIVGLLYKLQHTQTVAGPNAEQQTNESTNMTNNTFSTTVLDCHSPGLDSYAMNDLQSKSNGSAAQSTVITMSPNRGAQNGATPTTRIVPNDSKINPKKMEGDVV